MPRAGAAISQTMPDRARHRHRTGAAWSKSAVRAVLANPRYTSYQVWNLESLDAHQTNRVGPLRRAS